MKASLTPLLLACLCCLQSAAQPATWRAVSIDIKDRQQSGESQTAGSIEAVSYNSNGNRFTIPFAKPTARFPLGSGSLSLFQHPQPAPAVAAAANFASSAAGAAGTVETAGSPTANSNADNTTSASAGPTSAAGTSTTATANNQTTAAATPDATNAAPATDSATNSAPAAPAANATPAMAAQSAEPPLPPTLLAQIQLPANRGDMLLLLWPSAQAASPYRLLPIPDQRPQPGKRILRLINCTPQTVYALVEGKPHEILPLQPLAVECDAEGRSRVELYRPPQPDAPARRISTSSYRVTEGEMLTALLLPAPDAAAPRVHVFRDY